VTEGANVLTDGCLRAADEAPEDNLREQFRLCLKSVAAAVNTFCGSIKFLKDRPTETNYRACQVLSLYPEDSGFLGSQHTRWFKYDNDKL
jgi:hypothetical protein